MSTSGKFMLTSPFLQPMSLGIVTFFFIQSQLHFTAIKTMNWTWPYFWHSYRLDMKSCTIDVFNSPIGVWDVHKPRVLPLAVLPDPWYKHHESCWSTPQISLIARIDPLKWRAENSVWIPCVTYSTDSIATSKFRWAETCKALWNQDTQTGDYVLNASAWNHNLLLTKSLPHHGKKKISTLTMLLILRVSPAFSGSQDFKRNEIT